jgi:heat-inducible transcriptional repressor
LSAFEEKEELRSLVNEALSDESSETGIQVYIGNETPIQTMKDCSVVTATYELGDGVKGTIGIIGPKRMDYKKVIASLDYFAEGLTNHADKAFGIKNELLLGESNDGKREDE